MTNSLFPPLPLTRWQETRDTIREYAELPSRIRRTLTPARKHWWHISLRATASGLTTTPIRSGHQTFELLLDFTYHRLLVTTSHGERRDFPLLGQSVKAFHDQTMETLAGLGIKPEIDHDLFSDETSGSYDKTAVSAFWQALSQIDTVLKEFRNGFRKEGSPVQFWPHNFDMAVLWLSGRLVPDQDPQDPEYADEQMNFGFSTGDGGIPEPYFYATAYPAPEGWTDTELPQGAYWQSAGWSGAVLPYEVLVNADDGRAHLLDFLNTAHKAGAELMK